MRHIPRIAYCSPVNPAHSGISDYSEELLPYLGQFADITLYLEDGLRPTNPHLARSLEVRPLRHLPRAHRRRPYDAILYHMGNSPVHAGIWQMAQRVPGVVVMHDFVLHHFMLWYAANTLHDIQRYVHMMRELYDDEGDHIAQLMIRGRFTTAAFRFPCCEPVVQAAHAVLAHSRFVQQHVAALRPDVACGVVPMGVPLPPLLDKAAARAWLGLPPDALVLASFGHINAYKRVETVLRVLAELRETAPNARDVRYVLVGSASPNYQVDRVIQRMGLADAVQMTGYVDRAVFEAYVAAADICLNLRYPSSGETSASLLRLLGAGKPTLMSATGAYAELPPDVVAQVDTDASEHDLVLAYCRLLIDRPDVAAALGDNARAFVAREHTLERSAEHYARFLAHIYRWDAVVRVRDTPLWELPQHSEQVPPTPLATPQTPPGQLAQSDETPAPPADAPVVNPPAIPDIARRLADIGVTEHDTILLRTVAHRLADLVPPETPERKDTTL